MDSITQPLSRVVEAMQDLVYTKQLRLLHVVTTSPLRSAVLDHIAAAEHLSANRSPFLILETPSEGPDNGWPARLDELRGEGKALGELAPQGEDRTPPPASPTGHLARFSLEIRAVLERLRAPLEGLVLVLAPLRVQTPTTWVEELATLISRADLAQVRWVFVEADDATCTPLAETLGPRARAVDARVDEARQRAEAEQLLAAMLAAPPGATGARLCGAAGPREPPPPRKSSPAALKPTLAKEAGLSESLGDAGFLRRLRSLVLEAARAMRDGSTEDAVRKQREAQDLCRDAGLVRESVVLDLVLGGYALQGGAPECALEVFHRAKQRATDSGFAELAVQAQLAIGACLVAQKHPIEAATAYAEAGRLGTRLDAPLLAIEGYRMAGQLLASANETELAGAAWRRALDVAEGAGTVAQRLSSAPDVARALAALCRTHGLTTQAAALEAQATAMETPGAATTVRQDPLSSGDNAS